MHKNSNDLSWSLIFNFPVYLKLPTNSGLNRDLPPISCWNLTPKLQPILES